ncbi:MAG: hypothetical protein HUU15_00230 [Candidatus Brocadiae bacterium]|nr:hypothetical protein [Candidatus Brocadiia bacterium]
MRSLLLLAALAVCPGCLINRWSASADGRLLAAFTRTAVVVTGPDLDRLEHWPAAERPAIVEISPNGRWIVYNTDKASGLWLIDREKKTSVQVGTGADFTLHTPWSPDSTRFAFCEHRETDPGQFGRLRIHNVLTGETLTALECGAPMTSWSPSGQSLFTLAPDLGPAAREHVTGTLVRWTGDGVDKLASVALVSFLHALDDSQALFTTATLTIPFAFEEDTLKKARYALFRASVRGTSVTRLADGVGWFSMSPDGKRLIAWVLEKDGEDPPIRLELFDRDGTSLRVLLPSAGYHPREALVPLWQDSKRVLVPIGPPDRPELKRIDVETGTSEDLSAKEAAWSR